MPQKSTANANKTGSDAYKRKNIRAALVWLKKTTEATVSVSETSCFSKELARYVAGWSANKNC